MPPRRAVTFDVDWAPDPAIALCAELCRRRAIPATFFVTHDSPILAELAQDPLKLLQSLSRNRTVVAAWPGNFDGVSLTYAEPGHPEARRYPTPQAMIVKASETGQSDVGSPGEETR